MKKSQEKEKPWAIYVYDKMDPPLVWRHRDGVIEFRVEKFISTQYSSIRELRRSYRSLKRVSR